MKSSYVELMERRNRLFEKAEAILDGRANGLGQSILQHLALRRYGPAMLSIASRMTSGGFPQEIGRIADPGSAAGLTYRAYRMREPNAAQNMALTLFNVGDLAGYRRWMLRASRAGETNAREELRRFETRQPHRLAAYGHIGATAVNAPLADVRYR